MKIPPIITTYHNVYCGSNIKQYTIANTPILENKYTYSIPELTNLEEKFVITNPYFIGKDFSMRKKDNTATIIVKNDCICAYTKNNTITLNVKPGLFRDTEHYFGTINNKQVKFSCKTYQNQFGEYELNFGNVKNIDKEVLDIVSIQKIKKLKTIKYVNCNFNLIIPTTK